jgi:hypothetical protein
MGTGITPSNLNQHKHFIFGRTLSGVQGVSPCDSLLLFSCRRRRQERRKEVVGTPQTPAGRTLHPKGCGLKASSPRLWWLLRAPKGHLAPCVVVPSYGRCGTETANIIMPTTTNRSPMPPRVKIRTVNPDVPPLPLEPGPAVGVSVGDGDGMGVGVGVGVGDGVGDGVGVGPPVIVMASSF